MWKKNPPIILAFTFIFAVLAIAQGPPPPPKPLIYSPPESSELVEFTPEDETFSATFPSAPEFTDAKAEGVETKIYTSSRNGSRTVVGVTTFTSDISEREDAVFNAISDQLASDGRTIESKTPREMGGCSGNEFRLLYKDIVYRIHFACIVRDRVYEVSADVTNWHIIGDETKAAWEKEAERFFASFRIKEPVEPTRFTVKGTRDFDSAPDDPDEADPDMVAQLIETIVREQEWKPYELAEANATVELPREPAMSTEDFFDEGVGNTTLRLFVSAGDLSAFSVGYARFPYRMTDKDLLLSVYESSAEEFLSNARPDEIRRKEIMIGENFGMEYSIVPSDKRFPPSYCRIVAVDRGLYILMVTSGWTKGTDEPPLAEEFAMAEAEVKRFFDSFKPEPPRPIAVSKKHPMVGGNFVDGVYKSDHFGFSFAVPAGWIKLSDEDTAGVQQVGRDVMSRSTSSETIRRANLQTARNFASFVSGPLGNEGLAMISVNLLIEGKTANDAMSLIKVTEGLLSQIEIYEIIAPPRITKLGGVDVAQMENKINLESGTQGQLISMFATKGYLVGITITYHKESDRKAALETLEKTLKVIVKSEVNSDK